MVPLDRQEIPLKNNNNNKYRPGPSFPDVSVVKNLPANVEGKAFDPGSGEIPRAKEQLGPCATTIESVL